MSVFFEMTIGGTLKICKGVTYKKKELTAICCIPNPPDGSLAREKQLDVIHLVGEGVRDE